MGAHELYDGLAVSGESELHHQNGYAVAFSRGIRKLKNISVFLNVAGVVSPSHALRKQLNIQCVVVWGRKENSQRALRYAARRHLPVLFVEDGWIRSCSANAHSRTCYSILVDRVGVYYDSTGPSELENFLNRPDEQFNTDCKPADLQFAHACRQRMVDNNITKYNFCQISDPGVIQGDGRPMVLVIDQTVDDASVRYGGMDESAFLIMLDRAISENPDSRIVVRTHPDVVAGIRQGYLQSKAKDLGIELSAEGDNPLPWLKHASSVYVGTSQLGYEALLCGCRVIVAGKPFYSGWGLTEDMQPVERRTQRRSLDQLFHATHVYLARYCCPVTGQPWTIQDCLDHVTLQLEYFERNAGRYVCVGITPWKKRYVNQYLRSPYGMVRFSRNNHQVDSEQAVYWSFSDEPNIAGGCKAASAEVMPSMHSGRKPIRIEDGFIRSRGLGSDFTPPGSLVFDDIGLYFDASGPSKLENLLNNRECTESELERARGLRCSILSSNLTKYNLTAAQNDASFKVSAPMTCKRILVVGQVEGDQSILKGSKNIQSNSQLLVAVRESNPDAYIVYKPHPDVVSGNRVGSVAADTLRENVNRVESSREFLDCLDECDELHTMTSLSGFEAIMRNKPVVTYGLPFYAGWGLTRDECQCNRRVKKRSLDELVFLTLIAYPHYLDLDSGEFISVEQMIEILCSKKAESGFSTEGSWWKKVSNITSALLYQC